MKEEYRTSSNFHWCINIVESRVQCAHPTIQCRYDSGIPDFDIAMENVSNWMDQYLMVDILIINVRVKRTRSGFETSTDTRHHGISSDIFTRKRGIGIDKENKTFQSTTQDNVRSYPKPLKRWYITYLMSQRLRRLNFRFYAGTLFAKEKSIVSNTCA